MSASPTLSLLFAASTLALASCVADEVDREDRDDEDVSAITTDEIEKNALVVNDTAGSPLYKISAMYSPAQGKTWARTTILSAKAVSGTAYFGAQIEHFAGTGFPVTGALIPGTRLEDVYTRDSVTAGRRACGSFTGTLAGALYSSRQCIFFEKTDRLSAPAQQVGSFAGPGRASTSVGLIAGVSSIINTAADRYAAGTPSTVDFVTNTARGSYTSDASIFASLINAGVLPPGSGPGFLAAALDGLNASGQRLRVGQICDVIGIKIENVNAWNERLTFAFSNIALRGSTYLLETEQFVAEQSPTGNGMPGGWTPFLRYDWRIKTHDFVRAEVPNVTSCASLEAAAARADMIALCKAAGSGGACPSR